MRPLPQHPQRRPRPSEGEGHRSTTEVEFKAIREPKPRGCWEEGLTTSMSTTFNPTSNFKRLLLAPCSDSLSPHVNSRPLPDPGSGHTGCPTVLRSLLPTQDPTIFHVPLCGRHGTRYPRACSLHPLRICDLLREACSPYII